MNIYAGLVAAISPYPTVVIVVIDQYNAYIYCTYQGELSIEFFFNQFKGYPPIKALT